MRIVMMVLYRFGKIALAVAACVLLSRRFEPWPALGLWAGGMAVACMAASLLLTRAPLERVTWINYVGGFFIPWGYWIGRGRLAPAAVVSWLVWVLLGAGTILLMAVRQGGGAAGGPGGDPASNPAGDPGAGDGWSVVLRGLLLLAWLVDGGALLYLLGIQARYPGRIKPVMLGILAVPAGLIAGSAALALWGGTNWALLAAVLLAGGPPAMIAGVYGLFMLIILTSGRGRNWH